MKEGAKHTWTGKIADSLGLKNVSKLDNRSNSVVVVFSK
jgi:hypothetical protein